MDPDDLSVDSEEETIIEGLLSATPFNVVYNGANTVTNVFRD